MTSRPYREIQLDPSCISAVPVSIPSARVQRQVLSQDQWEDLKPIIRRLYIEENQTFPKICTILSSTHGFTPTKRQFNSKINRWGFRKNATKEERRRIAQSSNGQTTLGANGKAISQKIRKRWEKEFRPVNGEDLQISRDVGLSKSRQPAIHEPLNSVDAETDSWHWSSIDIPGSPTLTRLFAALEIYDPPNGIDLLSLSQPKSDNPVDATQNFPPAYFNLNSPSGDQTSNTSTIHKPYEAAHRLRPFLELYPFPVSVPIGRQDLVPSATPNIQISSLRARSDSLHTALATFSSTFPSGNPIFLRAIEEVAVDFYDYGDFELSVSWWRRAFSLLQDSGGISDRRTLSAMNQLYRSKMLLHFNSPADPRMKELNDLEAQLESRIAQSLPAADEIALDFILYKVVRHLINEQHHEAEALLRQLLQISLSSLGPRDNRTIRAMSELGWLIATTKHDPSVNTGNTAEPNADKEKTLRLARAAINLYKESRDLIEEKGFYLINSFLPTLRSLGHVAEAVDFGNLVLSQCIPKLGEESYWSIRYMSEVGASLRVLKCYPESIALLQRVLRAHDADPLTEPTDDIRTFCINELGLSFRELGKHREAIECYKLGAWADIDGHNGSSSKLMKEMLWAYGDSYVQVGQHDAALELLEGYLKAFEEHGEKGREWTKEVRVWIEDVKRVMPHGESGYDGEF